jgi:peptidoglycan/LPS O-acetylase OafA/YrhL
VAWTLSFEWLFYFLFFGSILLSVRRKAFFLSGLLIALVIVGWVFHPADLRMIFLTNPLLLEFMLGVGLYWGHQKIKVTRTAAWVLLLTGIILYGCEVFTGFGGIWRMEDVVSGQLSFTRFLVWGLPSASLVAGCIFLENNEVGKRVWNNRLFSLIGDASYSIYLTHLSVYLLCSIAYTRMGLSLNPDLAIFLQCLLALAGGIFFYKVAEAPLLQKMKRTHKRILPA